MTPPFSFNGFVAKLEFIETQKKRTRVKSSDGKKGKGRNKNRKQNKPDRSGTERHQGEISFIVPFHA